MPARTKVGGRGGSGEPSKRSNVAHYDLSTDKKWGRSLWLQRIAVDFIRSDFQLHHLNYYMLRLSQTIFQSMLRDRPSNPETWAEKCTPVEITYFPNAFVGNLCRPIAFAFMRIHWAHKCITARSHPVTQIYIQQGKRCNIRDVREDGVPVEK